MSKIINYFARPLHKYGTSTILTLCLVYFAQGFRTFGSTAQTLYFKNVFGLDPSELTIVSAFTDVSWYLKPLFGLISDSFPILGYRRKSYLLIAAVLGMIAYTTILISTWLWVSILALIFSQLSQAIADVICDGFMVEKSKIDEVNGPNDLQRYSWGSLFVGGVIGTILGGNAADYIDPRYIITALSICPFLVLICVFSIDEVRSQVPHSIKEGYQSFCTHLSILFNAAKQVTIIKVIAFAIFWQTTLLGFSNIFTYYLYDILFISPSTASYYTLTAYLGMFFATIFNFRSLASTTILKKLFIGRVTYSLLTIFDIIILTGFYNTIRIPFYYFLFGSSMVGSMIDMLLSRMPLLIIFVKITPKHVEASFFAMLGAVFNFGMFLSEMCVSATMEITGIDSEYDSKVWVLSMISMGVGLASVGILFLLPEELRKARGNYDQTEEAKQELEIPLVDKKGNNEEKEKEKELEIPLVEKKASTENSN